MANGYFIKPRPKRLPNQWTIPEKRMSDEAPAHAVGRWRALRAHCDDLGDVRISDLFDADARRFENYSVACRDLFLDYSKNRINGDTLRLLFALARECGFDDWRERLFSGAAVNCTERRPALHTALRRRPGSALVVDGRDVAREIEDVRARMRDISDALRAGAWRGASGKTVRDVVSIGIGGSHLGACMACRTFAGGVAPRVHFVSMPGTEMERLLASLERERTLFVVISKSFATRETRGAAERAAAWLGDADRRRHLLAVSANADAVARLGVARECHLPIPPWVGGRHSLCAAAGLPFAIHAGMDAFEELLDGARHMDLHFAHQPLESNAPAILALLDVWYVNFHGAQSRAVLPYDRGLALLPAYLQQLEMESNGKSTDREGRALAMDSAPVTWGGDALEGQHAFYQLLHQGTRPVPVDFIISTDAGAWSWANLLAQSRLLMQGVAAHSAWRRHPGNRPSNAIVLRRLTPRTLGALIALYEHKVFTASVVWNVNPFDQPGVEAGKNLAREIVGQLEDGRVAGDVSTRGLAKKYRQWAAPNAGARKTAE